MLRTMLGPKREEIKGGRRKLHNEEFHILYSAENVIGVTRSRTMRLAGHVAQVEEMKHAYKILAGKPEGKKPVA